MLDLYCYISVSLNSVNLNPTFVFIQSAGEKWEMILPASDSGKTVRRLPSDLNSYLELMSKDGTWADCIVISAASLKYGRPIVIYNSPNSLPIRYFSENHVFLQEHATTDNVPVLPPICLAFIPVPFGHRKETESEENRQRNHYISLIESSFSLESTSSLAQSASNQEHLTSSVESTAHVNPSTFSSAKSSTSDVSKSYILCISALL